MLDDIELSAKTLASEEVGGMLKLHLKRHLLKELGHKYVQNG